VDCEQFVAPVLEKQVGVVRLPPDGGCQDFFEFAGSNTETAIEKRVRG
jgi:hypothetical protein